LNASLLVVSLSFDFLKCSKGFRDSSNQPTRHQAELFPKDGGKVKKGRAGEALVALPESG
jgi:hypothetical protein